MPWRPTALGTHARRGVGSPKSHALQGANFFPATGKCHLFEACDGLEDELAVTAIVPQLAVDTIEDADQHPTPASGPYAELTSAIPIVLINITNFTGLISSKDHHLPPGLRSGPRRHS